MTTIGDAAEETRRFWEGRTAVEGPRATRFHGGHDDFDLPAIRALCTPGASVLDLGCGTCVVANELIASTQCLVHAVDYVPEFLQHAVDDPRLTTAHGDVRTYLDPQRHDVVLLLGVITYLDDPAQRRDLYQRCAAMLEPGGTLFVKAQFGVCGEVVIDTESEALGSRYHAVYPWLAAEVALLSECFDVEVRDPYPAEFNTYDNTHFHHLVATRRDTPGASAPAAVAPATVATVDPRRAEQEGSRDLLVANLQLLNDTLATTPIAGRTWIFGGLHLGIVREGGIMLHDTKDVDFAFLGEDVERLGASFPALIEAGFTPHFRFPGLAGEATEFSFIKDDAKFEFFRLDRVGDELIFHHYGQLPDRSIRNRCAIPAQPLAELRLADRTWLAARDADVELTALFDDWRTPNPDWNYLEGPSVRETSVWDDATFHLWGEQYRMEAPAADVAAAPATPKASIVLVARDRVTHTLRSLQAIAQLPEAPGFEVVVVDDGSTDATPVLLGGLEGNVRVLRNVASVGFGAACDQAAAAATGEQLVFLDADAVPVTGWLTALSTALDAEGVDAALPQSVRPNGGLQPHAQWLALAVRRSAFDAVGGFAGTAQPGRAEKGSLLDALAGPDGTRAVPTRAVVLAAPDVA
jgi:SAM-dependent methyltransferase